MEIQHLLQPASWRMLASGVGVYAARRCGGGTNSSSSSSSGGACLSIRHSRSLASFRRPFCHNNTSQRHFVVIGVGAGVHSSSSNNNNNNNNKKHHHDNGGCTLGELGNSNSNRGVYKTLAQLCDHLTDLIVMGQEELIGVLMTSICEKPASSVAALLDVTRGPSLRQDHPLLEAFPYRVRTKYFTADIQLYACADPSELSDAELAQFEALVVLFDANCDNFKEKAEQLQQLRARCCNSEVNLALCELCDNEQIKKMFAERLSDFELIESEVNADDQDECGLERMKEALRMHTWSNMVMHDREKLPGNPRLPEHLFTGGTVPLPPLPQEVAGGSSKPEDEDRDAAPLPREYQVQQQDHQQQPQQQQAQQDVSDHDRADAAAHPDPEQDMAFEELFAKFVSLKTQAMSLNGGERRKFAEEVVMQFWKAMGQDEAELEGLDSDSD